MKDRRVCLLLPTRQKKVSKMYCCVLGVLSAVDDVGSLETLRNKGLLLLFDKS